jgi:hypothetical protein
MPPVASTVHRFIGLIAAGTDSICGTPHTARIDSSVYNYIAYTAHHSPCQFQPQELQRYLALVKKRNGLHRIARMKTSYPPLTTGSVIASAT